MERSLRELFKLIYYLFADHKKIKITCHRLPQYILYLPTFEDLWLLFSLYFSFCRKPIEFIFLYILVASSSLNVSHVFFTFLKCNPLKIHL